MAKWDSMGNRPRNLQVDRKHLPAHWVQQAGLNTKLLNKVEVAATMESRGVDERRHPRDRGSKGRVKKRNRLYRCEV